MANPVNQEPVVNLYSSDGVHFQVPKRLAMFSGAIKRILEDVPQEALSSNTVRINLYEISSPVLTQVIEYFKYKERYSVSPGIEIAPFYIDPDLALSLMIAADFLEV